MLREAVEELRAHSLRIRKITEGLSNAGLRRQLALIALGIAQLAERLERSAASDPEREE
jgi:hypothetical protein